MPWDDFEPETDDSQGYDGYDSGPLNIQHDPSDFYIPAVECTLCAWSGKKKDLKNGKCPNCQGSKECLVNA